MSEYTPVTEAGKEAIANGADPKVVEQMEKDGELSNDNDSKEDKKETPQEEHFEDKKPDESESKKDDDDSGDDKKDDKSEDKDEEEEPENNGRTPKFMPTWKHKEELKKAEERIRVEFEQKFKDAKEEIQNLANKPGGASDEEVTKLADELGFNVEATQKLVDRITDLSVKKLGIGDIKKTVDDIVKQSNEKKEEQGFEEEVSGQDTLKAIKSVIGDRVITPEEKAKIKTLAYTTTYAKYRLADIIKLESTNIFGENPTQKQTAEKGKGTARGQGQKPVTEMSSDELAEMSDDEFLKLSNELGKTGSRYDMRSSKKK